MTHNDKLDIVINGTRYRSSRCIKIADVEHNGVRVIALWICKYRLVTESYSIFDRGDGQHVGTIYTLIDADPTITHDGIHYYDGGHRYAWGPEARFNVACILSAVTDRSGPVYRAAVKIVRSFPELAQSSELARVFKAP